MLLRLSRECRRKKQWGVGFPFKWKNWRRKLLLSNFRFCPRNLFIVLSHSLVWAFDDIEKNSLPLEFQKPIQRRHEKRLDNIPPNFLNISINLNGLFLWEIFSSIIEIERDFFIALKMNSKAGFNKKGMNVLTARWGSITPTIALMILMTCAYE